MTTHLIRRQASKLYKTFEKARYMFHQKNIYKTWTYKQTFVEKKKLQSFKNARTSRRF